MWPTPDPSASLTPWREYLVANIETAQTMVGTMWTVVVIALALILFGVGIIAAVTAYRRLG